MEAFTPITPLPGAAFSHSATSPRRPEDTPRPGPPPATLVHPRRGGRAVECGGLENRFGLLGPTRVQIPPPPLIEPKHRTVQAFWLYPRPASPRFLYPL